MLSLQCNHHSILYILYSIDTSKEKKKLLRKMPDYIKYVRLFSTRLPFFYASNFPKLTIYGIPRNS